MSASAADFWRDVATIERARMLGLRLLLQRGVPDPLAEHQLLAAVSHSGHMLQIAAEGGADAGA